MLSRIILITTRRSVAVLTALLALTTLIVTPAFAARTGYHQIAAHGGDRERMPNGWKESEWENSVQAMTSANERGVRWLEMDVQLNRHASAITTSTPYGILYAHHDAKCEEINSSGKGTGVWRNIATDDPRLVDRCAERTENMLNLPNAGANRWILEMKGDTGYTTALPKALYHLLKKRGQRTTEIVSSLKEGMLNTLRDEASRDGITTLNLMRVYGATYPPGTSDIDHAKALGFKYINANVNDWQQANVDYAKNQGLYVVGWHWMLTSCTSANQKAVDLDLDIMMTDCIGDMQWRGWF